MPYQGADKGNKARQDKSKQGKKARTRGANQDVVWAGKGKGKVRGSGPGKDKTRGRNKKADVA